MKKSKIIVLTLLMMLVSVFMSYQAASAESRDEKIQRQYELQGQIIDAIEHKSKTEVELLLDKGVDVNLVWSVPNEHVSWTPLLRAAAHNCFNIVELLLDKGADPEVTNHEGWTPLMGACLEGHKEIVELLLGRGADVNKKLTEHGPYTSALAIVIGSNGKKHKEIAKMLIHKGADGSDLSQAGKKRFARIFKKIKSKNT